MEAVQTHELAKEEELNALYRLIRVKENIFNHDEAVERLLEVLSVPNVALAPRVQVLTRIDEYLKK